MPAPALAALMLVATTNFVFLAQDVLPPGAFMIEIANQQSLSAAV